MGFPDWFLSFVKGSLDNVKVAPCFGRSLLDWIDIERGVKQGCPLSPLIFILAYDPLLFSLSSLPDVGIYAFADDLALTAVCVADISPALLTISTFSRLSGLGINRDKSCVVSSAPVATYGRLREELRDCPWPDLPLRDSATHLGIVIGRNVTLADIFESPYKKAITRINGAKSVLKNLSVSNRILFVNTFIISLFSYHFLFFVIPKEFYKTIKGLIIKLVTPFNGGAYTYESLVCLNFVFSIRPPLKDLWAVNVALLAVRSPLISSTSSYRHLPAVSIVFSKFIRDHRDAAAVDFWRDRHLDDGTLTPLLKCTSPLVYQALVEDVYLQKAADHVGKKVSRFVLNNSPSHLPPPLPECIESISKALSVAARTSPPSFLFHHFALINNALATSRRMRHQNGVQVVDVPRCFFCRTSDDSLVHLYTRCSVVHKARVDFFTLQGVTARLAALFPYFEAPPPLCFPFPLTLTFLIDVPPDLSVFFLAFNYAVWRFRVPAQSTFVECADGWRSARITEMASSFLARVKTPHKRRAVLVDDSVIAHDEIVETVDADTLVCYTDGSASPNPGPAGAGACLFFSKVHTVTDLGVSLGHGSNNLGELAAIGLCLTELLRTHTVFPCPSRAIVFTDSLFASNAVTSKKVPATHAVTVFALRSLLADVVKLFPVTFHWIRGHSGAGGNERADRVAKVFALGSVGLPTLPSPTLFPGHKSCSDWPFSLASAPLHAFLVRLPSVPVFASLPPPFVPTVLPNPTPALHSHHMLLRGRAQIVVVDPLPVSDKQAPVQRLVPPSVVSHRSKSSSIARLFARLKTGPPVVRAPFPVTSTLDNDPDSGLDFKHDS